MAIPEELRSVLVEIEDANRELARAVESGNPGAISLAFAQLTAAEKRRNHLVHRTTRAATPTYRTQFPVRDMVIAALKVINRPSSVKLVADIARVRNNDVIDTRGLASLRRDEMRSWVLAHQEPPRAAPRDLYVVPALSYDRFLPVRGALALSDAPDHLRFLAPRSPRADLLTTMTELASIVMANPDRAETSGLSQLMAELARTLREANPTDTHDPRWVIETARAELSLILDRDLDDRHAAAERAKRQLSDVDFLFGAGANEERAVNTRRIA
jgi:hypothetical protein